MSPIEKQTHIHTYKKSRRNKEIYRCVHPKCSHYTYRDFLFGKIARCNGCDAEMTLTPRMLRTAAPKCDMCRNTKENKERLSIEEILRKQKVVVEANDGFL